ncbi:MAG TPA: cyclic nucleotide-binding domain-containing protein [Candidatus Aquilonibacter sp.]|nr:cyclic nucleotide-binding domain-containing protein [Candidatus Aquilonibacter sp.]
MESQEPNDAYFIWGIDDAPYGPVKLPMLVDWINDGRVLADTWVFARNAGNWQKAVEIPELENYFVPDNGTTSETLPRAGLTPGALRRIKILADMKDAQLAHLSDFMELQEVPQWSVLFNQGDAGDAMYLVMAGELRARTMIGERETILAIFSAGDFFGDMALFDNGPRSADVIANVDSTLLKISAANFNRLTREAPALATPFLQATARTLSARIRADNKRFNRVSQQFQTGAR